MSRTVRVFNIQRFCTDDGPGIRTAVFLKGCGLACEWCHNPESISPKVQVQFLEDKCIDCGRCRAACEKGLPILSSAPDLLETCAACRACVESCPAGAIEILGTELSVEELEKALLRDAAFYENSGGGVTFSGGEPMLQIDALLPLLRKRLFHTAIETAGFVDWRAFEKSMEFVDLYLYDIKAITPAVHAGGTGQDNRLILANLERLYEEGKRIIVRTPVIPGFNDSREEMDAIAAFVRAHPAIEAHELMPFNNAAKHKYDSLKRRSRYYNA